MVEIVSLDVDYKYVVKFLTIYHFLSQHCGHHLEVVFSEVDNVSVCFPIARASGQVHLFIS